MNKMKMVNWRFLLFLVLCCSYTAMKCYSNTSRQYDRAAHCNQYIIEDFEESLKGILLEEENDTKITKVSGDGVSHGKHAMAVAFSTSQYPGFGIVPKRQDWSKFDCLKADVFNPSDKDVQISVRVDDAESNSYGTRFNVDRGPIIKPGANTIEIPILRIERGKLYCRGSDSTKIVLVKFFIGKPKAPVRLVFDHIRLEATPRSKQRTKDLLGTGGQRTWKANGSQVSETATGLALKPGGGEWPGVDILNPGNLYGWTVLELGYRSIPEWRTISIKLVSANGDEITMATGIRGQGRVIVPLFAAAAIPLGNISKIQVFFKDTSLPDPFEITHFRMHRFEESVDPGLPEEGTGVVADFSNLHRIRRGAMFSAWLWLPQKGRGGRWIKRTVARNKTLTRIYDRDALAGYADPGLEKKASLEDSVLLTGFFREHGILHFSTREIRISPGKTETVLFSIKEVAR